MDTSETFIKMRLAAITDMGEGKPIKYPAKHVVNDVYVDSKGDFYYTTTDTTVRLERQDQIQAMLEFGAATQFAADYVYHFNEFVQHEAHPYVTGSMEQLWLAFYFKEAHNKTWDGEKWSGVG